MYIAFVHHDRPWLPGQAPSMAAVRFLKISEALANRGHRVDRILNRPGQDEVHVVGPGLREVPFSRVRWSDYDLVKTLFHQGFETLEKYEGHRHPRIWSKLGSVVAREQTAGVHFFGRVRETLFETQTRIAARARAVTILTQPSIALWRAEHGDTVPVYQIPTGTDAHIPEPGPNPYPRLGIEGPVVFFAGNLYDRSRQPEVNALWQDRLNRVGRALKAAGFELVVAAVGHTQALDPSALHFLGGLEMSDLWSWQHHACAGLSLAQGPIQDNESSKLYYYARSGLPAIVERPIPNASFVDSEGARILVEYDDISGMVEAAQRLYRGRIDRDVLIQHIRAHHTWDERAWQFDRALQEVFGKSA